MKWIPDYRRRVASANRTSDCVSGRISISSQSEEAAGTAWKMGTGKRAVDYGMAEALAFASLVKAAFQFV